MIMNWLGVVTVSERGGKGGDGGREKEEVEGPRLREK